MAFFKLRAPVNYEIGPGGNGKRSNRETEFKDKSVKLTSCLTKIHAEEVLCADLWQMKKISRRTVYLISPNGLRLNSVFPIDPVGHFGLDTTQMKD